MNLMKRFSLLFLLVLFIPITIHATSTQINIRGSVGIATTEDVTIEADHLEEIPVTIPNPPLTATHRLTKLPQTGISLLTSSLLQWIGSFIILLMIRYYLKNRKE